MPGGTDQTHRRFLWSAAKMYPDTEIVSRPFGDIQRYDYKAYAGRVTQVTIPKRFWKEHEFDDGDRVDVEVEVPEA